jgi:hypothetical protein
MIGTIIRCNFEIRHPNHDSGKPIFEKFKTDDGCQLLAIHFWSSINIYVKAVHTGDVLLCIICDSIPNVREENKPYYEEKI